MQDKAIKTYVDETKRFYAPTSRELAAHRQAVKDLENDDSSLKTSLDSDAVSHQRPQHASNLVPLFRSNNARNAGEASRRSRCDDPELHLRMRATEADDPEFSPYVYDLIASYQAASRHRRQFTGQVLHALKGEASTSTRAAPAVFASCYRDWTSEYVGKQRFKALLVAPRSMPRGTTQEQKTARESLLRQFGK